MATRSIAPAAPAAEIGRTKPRVLAVLGGIVAALVVWAVAEAAVDDLRTPAFATGDAPQELGAPLVALVSGLGGLIGWALLALFERFFARAHRIWAVVATLALIVSFGGPIGGHGASTGSRISLALMHVAVAAVVIPALYRSSSRRSDATA